MILKWHPDRNKAMNAHEMSVQINEAYEILSDFHKRKTYDELIRYYKSDYSADQEEMSQDEYEEYYNKAKEEVKQWAEQARVNAEEFLNKTFDEVIKWGRKNENTTRFVYDTVRIVATCFTVMCIIGIVIVILLPLILIDMLF